MKNWIELFDIDRVPALAITGFFVCCLVGITCEGCKPVTYDECAKECGALGVYSIQTPLGRSLCRCQTGDLKKPQSCRAVDGGAECTYFEVR